MAKISAVLIFGAPGSGKGTVGAKLAATTSLKHLSTGDIFRGIAPSSESGKLLASYSSKGLLVPNEATVEIFGRYVEGLVNTNKLNPEKDTLLLDGIPRTVEQVKLIESIVDVKHIFVLDIKDEATIVARLLNRAKIEGRKDDADENVIKNRLKVYKESTAKVLSKYNKKIISHIVGDNTPDEVFCDVLKAYVDFCKASAPKAKKAPAKKPAAKAKKSK
ncbi:nucleoside monophosphate kinase [Fibrobacter sp. UWEL]|uniref:adenylate kinase family protein n=1 Tax=Fibrobacter sp. UWEL TaxID=1896209 RepID=UPI0009226A43|nr:nucleoside monophosphate kinase [Fibrobacter sp. UWEL]SHK44134.1 adenylate kinase [Fibrobacter sp. UWEL]